MRARVSQAASLAILLLCCGTAWAKVHELVWDLPTDGLMLPSVSTAKCGDVIRFKCPPNAKHGVFKLQASNYNGTCPRNFDHPSVGEVLAAPTQACDFSLTLSDSPDFFITSQAPGACEKNLKVYVHTVCVADTPTSLGGLFGFAGGLPGLSSLGSSISNSLGSLTGASAAAGAAPAAAAPGAAAPAAAGGKQLDSELPAAQPVLGAGPVQSRQGMLGGLQPQALTLGLAADEEGKMEAAQQNGAGSTQPALALLQVVGAAAVAVALAL